ncbi:rubisco methyltransferase family protein [Actinidia rufa]|uniref:Rubisco methyltransferase family protein n=1 Tax=Actinidia rufa TaxID=165716 RepID=A0A7J0GYD1_9ERIC|nr:rubisco methyltransferase family protein [Actinidia rufa]
MRLSLKLLQERAKTGSFWWPYISNLPETYSLPIFFPGEDIKNLQYAPLLHQCTGPEVVLVNMSSVFSFMNDVAWFGVSTTTIVDGPE